MMAQRGFSLIELMISVAILAILVTIAFPSYQSYLAKGARADAIAILFDAAAKQEQYYLDFHSYTGDLTALGYASDPLTYPTDKSASERSYKVTATGDADGFVITATAINAQASRDTDCASLAINQLGTRTSNGDSSDQKECWP